MMTIRNSLWHFPFPLGTGSNLRAPPGDVSLQPWDGRGAVREQGRVVRGEVQVLDQSLASTLRPALSCHGSCFFSAWIVPAGSGGEPQPAVTILTDPMCILYHIYKQIKQKRHYDTLCICEILHICGFVQRPLTTTEGESLTCSTNLNIVNI